MADGGLEFKFSRFNPRRAERGAEAAAFEVRENGELVAANFWMSVNHIKKNIELYGRQPELLKALEHYRTREEFPAREPTTN